MKNRLPSIAVIWLSCIAWLGVGSYDLRNNHAVAFAELSTDIFKQVILVEDPNIENVYAYLIFPSGEAASSYDEGLAHYVEHLAWISAFSEDVRNSPIRHSNAWTSRFSTGYWQNFAPIELGNALRRLVSVAAPLSLDTEFALQERQIVLREYDFRVAERPLYPVIRAMAARLYGDGRLSRSILGVPSAIAEFSLDDARALHAQSHKLSTATLLLYGDVNTEDVQTAISALSLKAAADAGRDIPEIKLVAGDSVQDDASLTVPKLAEDTFLYRRIVPMPKCGPPVRCGKIIQIAERILNSTLPGGIATPLRFERFVSRSFSLDVTSVADKYVQLNFIAYPDIGVALEELQNTFEAVFYETLTKGVPEESFARIVGRLKDDLDGLVDPPRYDRDLILELLRSGRSIFTWVEERDALDRIQLQDVNLFLNALMGEGRGVTRRVRAER